MIDSNNSAFAETLEFCFKHPEIHQTGSRYWNLINPEKVPVSKDTDYDFVAPYSSAVIYELEKRGFESRNEGFKDAIKSMETQKYINNYQREGTVIVYYFGSIQVILKSNLACYLRVQNTAGIDFYVNYLWKKNSTPAQIQDTLNFLYAFNKALP